MEIQTTFDNSINLDSPSELSSTEVGYTDRVIASITNHELNKL